MRRHATPCNVKYRNYYDVTLAKVRCQGGRRGFKSLLPLTESPAIAGLFFLRMMVAVEGGFHNHLGALGPLAQTYAVIFLLKAR